MAVKNGYFSLFYTDYGTIEEWLAKKKDDGWRLAQLWRTARATLTRGIGCCKQRDRTVVPEHKSAHWGLRQRYGGLGRFRFEVLEQGRSIEEILSIIENSVNQEASKFSLNGKTLHGKTVLDRIDCIRYRWPEVAIESASSG